MDESEFRKSSLFKKDSKKKNVMAKINGKFSCCCNKEGKNVVQKGSFFIGGCKWNLIRQFVL